MRAAIHWIQTVTRLFIIVTAVAFGLGGYWLGQQPGSPDIFGWLGEQTASLERSVADGQVKDAFDSGRRHLSELFSPEASAASASEPEPEPVSQPLSAKKPEPAKRERPPIPQCW